MKSPSLRAGIKPPIFIGGMFKSGTSLVRAMIGTHSQIFAGLETYWFDIDWQEQLAKNRIESIARICHFYGVTVEQGLELAEQAKSAEHFLDLFMKQQLTGHKTRWAEKTPGNIAHVRRILAFWPDARILHVLRDPRDVYSSLLEAKKVADADSFIRRWSTILPAALAAERDRKLRGNIFTLRYEDLVFEPEAKMRAIMLFVGEAYEDQVGQHKGGREDFDRVLQITGVRSTTLDRLSSPLQTTRIRLWHDKIGVEGDTALRRAAESHGVLEEYETVLGKYNLD